jgi:hypothetical protein
MKTNVATTFRRVLLRHAFVIAAAVLTGAACVPTAVAAIPAVHTAVFDPRDHGAVADGRTLDTVAIQKAIDACAAAGGGTVTLRGGVFLTGTILLKSNVTLNIESGAKLLGSPRIGDYRSTPVPALPKIAWALIVAEKTTNIGITGAGEIECNGEVFEGERLKNGKLHRTTPRPAVVRLIDSEHVRLNGFKLRDYPSFGIHLIGCRHVDIDHLAIDCHVQSLNDGIDIWDSEKVFISNCSIFSGDDCIAIMSQHRQCTDITIVNCQLSTLCQAVRIGPFSVKGLERIVVSNCVLCNVGHSGICLQMCQGGIMQDLLFSNIIMENVVAPISLRLGGWESDPQKDVTQVPTMGDAGWEKGVMRNVQFQNIRATVPALSMQGTPYEAGWRNVPKLLGMKRSCIQLMGTPGTIIENVNFSDVHFTFPGGGTAEEAARRDVPELERQYPTSYMFGILPAYGLYARHVRGLSMHNVHFDFATPDLRPAVVCDDVEDLELQNFRASAQKETESLARLVNVRRANIANSRPLGPVRHFLQLEQTAPAEVLLNGNDLRLVQPR